MEQKNMVIIDGMEVAIEGERNLLELIRKAGIDVPTFCYHSELSIYGACRLCTVEIEGRGTITSCSIPPEPGMKVRTNTEKIRRIRRVALELLLANHTAECTGCSKNAVCRLQELSRRFGIRDVRFKRLDRNQPIDDSSPAVVRDPNKCILCGDCVRMCSEVQGIGAIDFTGRGHEVTVQPAFGQDLGTVECVHCGQCARVCPTGALIPNPEIDPVWKAIFDPEKVVVAQIAPAVRVALGEEFGLPAGTGTMGQIVAALKRMGFDKVYDTCFAADMTVLEEGNEFLQRFTAGENLPQFTSCCPAWVKTVEQYYPQLMDNLSSCRSPQQMFGAVAKDMLPAELNVPREKIVVVSIMPCTAKKFEKLRPEFGKDGVRDVDHVLTTQELAMMIREYGIDFEQLAPASLDMPLGFKTGAGVIFGVTGGVSEAVLRLAYEKVTGDRMRNPVWQEVRGEEGVREVTLEMAGKTLRMAVVHGLKNARTLAEKVISGEAEYDLIEVMACPGGCIGGAGQPVSFDPAIKRKRTEGLYGVDTMLQLHKSQENPYLKKLYDEHLGEVGGEKAHHLLHTHYTSRRRMEDMPVRLLPAVGDRPVDIKVCVGTNCYLKGSQDLLHALVHWVQKDGLVGRVGVSATFCLEQCSQGPNATVDGETVTRATFEKVQTLVQKKLSAVGAE